MLSASPFTGLGIRSLEKYRTLPRNERPKARTAFMDFGWKIAMAHLRHDGQIAMRDFGRWKVRSNLYGHFKRFQP